jgi:hypothetical protein
VKQATLGFISCFVFFERKKRWALLLYGPSYRLLRSGLVPMQKRFYFYFLFSSFQTHSDSAFLRLRRWQLSGHIQFQAPRPRSSTGGGGGPGAAGSRGARAASLRRRAAGALLFHRLMVPDCARSIR